MNKEARWWVKLWTKIELKKTLTFNDSKWKVVFQSDSFEASQSHYLYISYFFS